MGRYRSRPRIWTLERVVAELQALAAGGETMTTSGLRAAGYAELVAAAQRHAGTWERAMRLAGIGYAPRRLWTKDAVIREIRRLQRGGHSLAMTKVNNALAIAATRLFGAWTKARSAAVPGFVELRRDWTRSRVLAAIRAEHRPRPRLTAQELRAAGRGSLVSVAVRMFGSWDVARRQAIRGFQPNQIRWSRATVVRAIQLRAAAGLSLAASGVGIDEPGLLGAARHHFGGWPAARAAAGIRFERAELWSASLVLSEISGMAARGERLVVTGQPSGMAAAARRHFGSWPDAVRAAGLVAHRSAAKDRGR